ncbi:MAG: glycerate kinase [Clostridia bacterium]|nr:glycerate kinase [Clostridia bacterium]
MNVVIAIDSFKGSLSSLDAGMAAAQGIQRAIPNANIAVRPIADGGEGTVEALCVALGGVKISIDVTGPLGDTVKADYGIIPKSRTAVIEMSAASGITLVPEHKRNPLNTTSYGVGEIISDAIERGCRTFLIGIGGSATNDGGIGMLQALGFDILNKDGNPVSKFGRGLEEVCSISGDNVNPNLWECSFTIACDVKNPLCGEMGSSRIYGPQKGADEETIIKMDKWLANFADISKCNFPNANKDAEGAGAAGGLGFAFCTFLNGKLTAGIELILRETRLEEYIKTADIVVTGEGRLDGQTVMGKAPVGVAAIAKKYGKKVIAFSGSAGSDAYLCNQNGIDAFFPIVRGACSLEEAMNTDTAFDNMADTVQQVFRLINVLEYHG